MLGVCRRAPAWPFPSDCHSRGAPRHDLFRPSLNLRTSLFPPPGHDRPASDLTSLFGRYAFPPCLATFGTALGAAFFAALSAQRDRVRILSPRHCRPILTRGR